MVALSSPHSLVGGGGGGGSIGAPRDMIMTSKMAQTDINMENMDQLVTNAATSGGFLQLGISFCLLLTDRYTDRRTDKDASDRNLKFS